MKSYVLLWVNCILVVEQVSTASLKHVTGKSLSNAHHHEKRNAVILKEHATKAVDGDLVEGARYVMGDIASKLLEHAGEHIRKHVKRAVRSTLNNRKVALAAPPADVVVPAPKPQGFVEAPPIGPMESLTIDIKGNAQTYKNFTKPSESYELENRKPNYRDVVSTSLSNKRSEEAANDEDEGSSFSTDMTNNGTTSAPGNNMDSKKPPRRKKKLRIFGKDSTENKTTGKKKRRKHNRNRYKVYSEFTSNSTSSNMAQENGTVGNNTIREGVVVTDKAPPAPALTLGANSVSELPPPPTPVVEDKMPAHSGDIGIDHDVPQEPIKEGSEQGPLLPEHEQGPKLPGSEKGPALLEESGPQISEKVAPINMSAHVEGPIDAPKIKVKGAKDCAKCVGPNGPGVTVINEKEGTMHCSTCPDHTVETTLKPLEKGEEEPDDAMRNLTKEQHPDGEPDHHGSHLENEDENEDVETVPPLSAALPKFPPIVDIQHADFEKMGSGINHDLLEVIEGNNGKVGTLWNEVKNVEIRLGNMEAIMELIEKAVHRIETKLESLSHPVYPSTPLAPSLTDLVTTHPFPRPPLSHSPVLKQFFIPLQTPLSPEAPKEAPNAGLPWPVSKFLTFLVQELMREKSTLQFEPGLSSGSSSGLGSSGLTTSGLANALSTGVPSTGLGDHAPHVPLPQPDLPFPPKEHDIDRLEYEIGKVPITRKKPAAKVYHPDIEEPSICHCENGGICNGRSECDCPLRYTGPRCERPVPRSPLLDSIINDMPADTLRQMIGARQAGLVTLPMMVVDKDDTEQSEQRVSSEGNENKLLSIISQYVGNELMQKFVKRHKVSPMRRRYVKYPSDKDKTKRSYIK